MDDNKIDWSEYMIYNDNVQLRNSCTQHTVVHIDIGDLGDDAGRIQKVSVSPWVWYIAVCLVGIAILIGFGMAGS